MADPDYIDPPLSSYSGSVEISITYEIEDIKGPPNSSHEVAKDTITILSHALNQKGMTLNLILEDWEIEELPDLRNDRDEQGDIKYKQSKDG